MEQQLIILQTAEQVTSPRLTSLHSPRATTGEGGWSDENLSGKGALQIQRLADCPPYQVQCSPWTSVINDDELASNLISMWLTWDKAWANFMDEQPFLHDMRRGRMTSKYCSPFLVNSVLAWACPYSDYLEARTQNGAISGLMQAFMAEAKRHLEEDMKKDPTLPLVQGLAFLYLTLCVSGQDRLGYQVMVQTIAMCEELERSPPEIEEDEAEAQRLSRAIDVTCWGVFNVTTSSFLSFMKPQYMKPPKRDQPAVRSRNDSWTPYPYQRTPVPPYNDELFQTHCNVSIVGAALTQMLFDNSSMSLSMREAKISKLRRQLLDQLASLPEHLCPQEGAPASVFIHQ
ncbi:hypothetical protein H2198_000141 [Neophaeococcomyces mojaviensis]|uniref:Uncharacterized protein n=1 Tax=Neophaeococcomyces mojaviensis TaxID=3383035 RepID=A0ACC3ALJ3_9EURO|nr:hypothetical protein H2198_000141 [Knufia sp. JES_112]